MYKEPQTLDRETLERIREADLLDRSLSEIIRDAYFDRIFSMIFASNYRGKIRILSTTEFSLYAEQDEGPDEFVLNVICPLESELRSALSDYSDATIVNLYFPT